MMMTDFLAQCVLEERLGPKDFTRRESNRENAAPHCTLWNPIACRP